MSYKVVGVVIGKKRKNSCAVSTVSLVAWPENKAPMPLSSVLDSNGHHSSIICDTSFLVLLDSPDSSKNPPCSLKLKVFQVCQIIVKCLFLGWGYWKESSFWGKRRMQLQSLLRRQPARTSLTIAFLLLNSYQPQFLPVCVFLSVIYSWGHFHNPFYFPFFFPR